MPKFIFCGDIHLRGTKPRCRRDKNWDKFQEEQIKFLFDIVKDNNCPLVISGDIFDFPKVSETVKNMFIKYAKPYDVYAIAGNHDLKHERYEDVESTSFGVLWYSKVVKPIPFGRYEHYSTEKLEGTPTGLYFLHRLVFKDKKSMPPNGKAQTAEDLLNEMPDAKYIFLGHIHQSFHYEKGGRHVLMAGSLNIQDAAEKDTLKYVWYIDTDQNIVDPILIPDDPELVYDDYIQEANNRKSRMGAFVELIKNASFSALDFKLNIKKAKEENPDLGEDVFDAVNELMEEKSGI